MGECVFYNENPCAENKKKIRTLLFFLIYYFKVKKNKIMNATPAAILYVCNNINGHWRTAIMIEGRERGDYLAPGGEK